MTQLQDAVNSGWITFSLFIIFLCLLVQIIIRFFTCPACFSSCFYKAFLSHKDQTDLDKIIDDDSNSNDIEMSREYDRSLINETVNPITVGMNHSGSAIRYGVLTKLWVEERRVKSKVKRLGSQLSESFADKSWIKCDDHQ